MHQSIPGYVDTDILKAAEKRGGRSRSRSSSLDHRKNPRREMSEIGKARQCCKRSVLIKGGCGPRLTDPAKTVWIRKSAGCFGQPEPTPDKDERVGTDTATRMCSGALEMLCSCTDVGGVVHPHRERTSGCDAKTDRATKEQMPSRHS